MATAAPAAPAAPATPRPSVMSLNIKEKSTLYASYMPHLKNGGLFIPSTKSYKLGDQVFMLLTLLEDPTRTPVQGTVVWTTPANCHGNKVQGVGVQFAADEAGIGAKRKIEGLLGGHLNSQRPTHTL
jgi:type IV pilus assembly protein PilZ